MPTRIIIVQQAGEFEIFAPGAFDNVVGSTVPVDLNGSPLGDGTMVDAVVAEDGKSVTLTVDLDDDTPDTTWHVDGGPPRPSAAEKPWDDLTAIVVRAIDERKLNADQRSEINMALLRVAGDDLGAAMRGFGDALRQLKGR